MRRRHFLTSIAALGGGLALGGAGLLKAGTPEFDAELAGVTGEEAFWRVIRRQFLFPEDYIYANTGGIGAVPSLVLHEVKKSLDDMEITPRPGHDHERWVAVKEACTSLLGPNVKQEELALTNTATEGINIILNGLPLKKGDELITSMHEHAALHVPLLNMVVRKGIVVRPFEPDLARGQGNVERIEKLMTRKTRLVFISHVTCTTGQRFPIPEIGNLVQNKGIWFAVDGAQAAGTMPMDVKGWGVDFYAFSGHKWLLGPKRTGVLFVREELLDTLRPTTVGAYSDDGYDIKTGELKFQPSAQRYEYGTQNEALYHGLGKAVDFVKTIGIERIERHNRDLADRFYEVIQSINGVTVLSPQEQACRTGIITFKMQQAGYRDIAAAMGEKRIRVRVVPEAGLDAVRVSFHVYNNADEVDMIAGVIKEIAQG